MRGFLFLSLLFSNVALSQKELKIGDRLPPYSSQSVLNYKSSNIDLADFKGKYIILDFWNLLCHACISSFPKIDSLQKQYGDKLQIILMSRDSKKATEDFFNKHKNLMKPSVPMITDDRYMTDRLPKEGYPYSVWIDSSGKIVYTFWGKAINEKNIASFLNGDPVNSLNATSKVYYGSTLDFLPKKIKPIKYYSTLFNCSDTINVGNNSGQRLQDSIYRISINCASVVELFKKAYQEGSNQRFSDPRSIILLGLVDYDYNRPYNYVDNLEWRKNHCFSYELIYDISMAAEAFRIMQVELSRIFKVKAEIVLKLVNGKNVECLQLSPTQ